MSRDQTGPGDRKGARTQGGKSEEERGARLPSSFLSSPCALAPLRSLLSLGVLS
jgi:hypothetical protein